MGQESTRWDAQKIRTNPWEKQLLQCEGHCWDVQYLSSFDHGKSQKRWGKLTKGRNRSFQPIQRTCIIIIHELKPFGLPIIFHHFHLHPSDSEKHEKHHELFHHEWTPPHFHIIFVTSTRQILKKNRIKQMIFILLFACIDSYQSLGGKIDLGNPALIGGENKAFPGRFFHQPIRLMIKDVDTSPISVWRLAPVIGWLYCIVLWAPLLYIASTIKWLVVNPASEKSNEHWYRCWHNQCHWCPLVV